MSANSANFLQTPLPPGLLAGFWAFAEWNDVSPSVALRLVAHHVANQAGFECADYKPGLERRGDFQTWARRRRRMIQEDGIHPVLIVRVTPGLKAAFAAYATSRGLSSPVALKSVVGRVVAAAKLDPCEFTPPKIAESRSARVTVRFSNSELAQMKRLAQDYESVRGWIVALVRAQIDTKVPPFTPRALQVLYESNRELAAIGRNVNQIAHAMNIDLVQSGELRRSSALLADLDCLKKNISDHTARVIALCEESSTRWQRS